MGLRTRVFLFSFVPFAVLLTFGFWMTQRLVQGTVRDGLRSSMRENHLAFGRVRSKSDLQNSRFLRIAGENPALKAGMRLLLDQPPSDVARNTVEDQLRELCTLMNFDLLLISAPDGTPLAGVVRSNGQLVPMSVPYTIRGRNGLLSLGGSVLEIASTPIDEADANLGSLSVGEYFTFSEFSTLAVLTRDGLVLESNIAGVPPGEIEKSMALCKNRSECDVRLLGKNYVSLPIDSVSMGNGYELRSLQDLDSATGPILASLRTMFIGVSCAGVLVTLLCNFASARTVVKPIGAMISQLRCAEFTGLLPELRQGESGVREIRDLTASFNRAAVSVKEAREGLQCAYVEFVESLANALDARDPYTAGHSWRVSRLSCSTAEALRLEKDAVDRIRIGALLHDIGKIGIADRVLQKPGRLTDEEMEVVKEHPEIGRCILEGVHGFAPFLGAVEFHHENWDGTGYPQGQSGEQTPVDARIIHVADAYDAMTTDRPYRPGMTREQAIRILKTNARTQFDPRIVEAFLALPAHKEQCIAQSDTRAEMVTS
jgi:HD-GYP domain-containing protein (c-di-GMP phosphodiesterase class II)